MTEAAKTYLPDDPANPNNLVVRGSDGDPLPTGTRMIEVESYERVVEGLKMAADACMHMAKHETVKATLWIDIAAVLDKMRRDAVKLAGLDLAMKQTETPQMRGEPYPWRQARQRFLDGMKQATGGMRQLATCFRGDFTWSYLAQNLERYERNFRTLMKVQAFDLQPDAQRARSIMARPGPRLILPDGFARG